MILFLLSAALVIAFATSSLLVPLVRRVAIDRSWVDKPDVVRKKHERPTPNVGGVAIFLGFLFGMVFLLLVGGSIPIGLSTSHLVLLSGALVMMIVGFYDDVHGLSFKRKFFFQILVAYGLISAGYRFDFADIEFLNLNAYTEALISIPLTLVWIVGIINAINLMDGLDGLASGVSMIAFSSLALIFALHGGDPFLLGMAILMIGATAGFLVFNFNPASIFMGDSGSLFIGYMLAAYSLAGTAHVEPLLAVIVPVVAVGLPVLDTGLCMIRRIIDGISPFSPDSDHIHHRLRRLWSTRTAVVILYAVSIWFGIAAILITQFDLAIGLLVVSVTLAAAMVGIRTLGYLKLGHILRRSVDEGEQLKLEFEKAGVDADNSPGVGKRIDAKRKPRQARIIVPHVGDGSSREVETMRLDSTPAASPITNGSSLSQTADEDPETRPISNPEERERLPSSLE